MADDPTGTDWTAGELDLIVADYFRMLQAELEGEDYSKAEHRNALLALIQRSKGSVEFKHQNISAVLQDLGLPWIRGYKPRSNYQGALLQAIERQLAAQPVLLDMNVAAPAPRTLADVFVAPPERLGTADGSQEWKRLVRRFDPAARDARNRQLGRAGEEFVLGIERRRLQEAGHGGLADRVRWVAQEDGDGAGFDILSFDTGGAERLLEVKTTCGAERTPFYLTRNELALSEERPGAFRLVRVHQFANDPKIFELTPPLASHVGLEPMTFRAGWS